MNSPSSPNDLKNIKWPRIRAMATAADSFLTKIFYPLNQWRNQYAAGKHIPLIDLPAYALGTYLGRKTKKIIDRFKDKRAGKLSATPPPHSKDVSSPPPTKANDRSMR